MHSPLPDASALEAGILEDGRPSRLSRVQDNVRNLLRASVFSSINGSTLASLTRHQQPTVEDDNPWPAPLHHHDHIVPEALPSPSSQTTTSSPGTDESEHEVSGVLFPPTSYQNQVQEMAHQSSMFNTRAVAALNHPELRRVW